MLSLALSPGTAHANCSGSTPSNGTLSIFGVVYGTETPVTGTCNGMHYYGGYDTKVYYVDFTDNNSNSEINFCVDNGVDWYCGWGTKYTHDTKWTDYYTHLMTGF